MKGRLTQEKIIEMQKELHRLNVVQEITDYRISNEYFELFLKRYSEFEGEYGYIQGAILTSLFDFIKKRMPNISESELISKSQKLYPIIRGMLVQEGAFKLIKDAKMGKLK
ncbi:hypothetical protein HYS31_03470 [Candidatus Woesearchaeota archaeon]|nr:hypothetical protein [Candidatus Woesearchaeota archaeon]